MKDNKIIGFGISDIHIGSHNTKRIEKELNSVFLAEVIKNKKDLDLIVIVGDYFDKEISFDEADGVLALSFLTNLISICKTNDILLRMVRGTLSHDLNQLNNFKVLQNDTFKIIDNIELETLFEIEDEEGETTPVNALYVPEAYPKNSEEYFSELEAIMEEGVDLLFLHGTFDFTAFEGEKIMSEKPIKTAPIFKKERFEELIQGAAICGHIHAPIKSGNIYYCNSFSRSSFGEDKPKGFLRFEIDTDSWETKVIRIENKLAPVYKTIEFSELFVDSNMPIETKVDVINQLKSKFENVRIVDSNGSSEVDSQILKSAFKLDDNVKINTKTKKQKAAEIEDTTFNFVINRELPRDETIQKFMKIKFDIDMETKRIEELLSKEKDTVEA